MEKTEESREKKKTQRNEVKDKIFGSLLRNLPMSKSPKQGHEKNEQFECSKKIDILSE